MGKIRDPSVALLLTWFKLTSMKSILSLGLVLISFMLFSCGGVEGDDIASEDVTGGTATTGATVYATNCLACHGVLGDGNGTELDSTDLRPIDVSLTIQTAVRAGKGLMPKFSKTQITTQQLSDLIAYILALPSASQSQLLTELNTYSSN